MRVVFQLLFWKRSDKSEMKVGVIGAGPAGLCAIKHCIAFNCEVIAFEQSDQIGGTWNYTDEVEKDKNGVDVHSSMYQGLLTNIPKEIMAFPEFPYPANEKSFLTSSEVLEYLRNYAVTFDLTKHIKFEHHVMRVRPLMNEKWEFVVNNFVADKCETFVFDAVLVCNGFSVPFIPEIPGGDVFKGKKLHSHHYRNSKDFKNEKVLVIGGGPSGTDLSLGISRMAEKIVWSNHNFEAHGKRVGLRVPEKPDVLRLTENGAEFVDGTSEDFTVIVLATGYEYKFPFLSIDCGLSCHEKYIKPLYKHCVNINHPSMAIIGIPYFATANPLFDLQVRFCLTFMTGKKKLPTRAEMLEDTEKDMNERWVRLKASKAHYLGIEKHAEYYDELSRTAKIEGIKPVIASIFNKSFGNYFEDFHKFRSFNYKIVDDEEFVMSCE